MHSTAPIQLNISPIYDDVWGRAPRYPAAPKAMPLALPVGERWRPLMAMLASQAWGASLDALDLARLEFKCKDHQVKRCQVVNTSSFKYRLHFDKDGYLILHNLQEGRNPSLPDHIGVHRLVCWWAWGPPPSQDFNECCHFACDKPLCLNPRHLRWVGWPYPPMAWL